jgi:hypothetical protein
LTVRYITGASNAAVKAMAKTYDIGLLLTPDTAAVRKTKSKDGPAGTPGGYAIRRHLDAYPFFALDNAGYGAKGTPFIPRWWTWLNAMAADLTADEMDRCLWATAPDVLNWFVDADGNDYCVGDPVPTLALLREWSPKIRALGFKVALVAGDGTEDIITDADWDLCDAVFLGGSTEWKIGPGAELIIKEATARGKATHMGRVNSGRRIKIADRFGCDTADGTYLKAGPDENLPNLIDWIRELAGLDPLPPNDLIKVRREVARRKLAAKKAEKAAELEWAA